MAPRLLAWLRPNLNLVGFFREVTVGFWQWPVIVFRRPSKLIFYIFTLCGMWIKIMRETATKYNLCHPNCIDVQYEQYQQCECLTNQHTGESELLWSTISMEWAWMRFTVILSDVQSKSRLVHTCHGESSSSCCWDRKRADVRCADCSTPWLLPLSVCQLIGRMSVGGWRGGAYLVVQLSAVCLLADGEHQQPVELNLNTNQSQNQWGIWRKLKTSCLLVVVCRSGESPTLCLNKVSNWSLS